MNLKHLFIILSVVLSSSLLSSCTSVSSQNNPEVVINDKTNSSSSPASTADEVYISDSDLKKENKPINTTQETEQLPKRLLADKSEIQTVVDGFGNKTETRYFIDNPRLRIVVLKTSVEGSREVMVYGSAGDTKIVPELADTALTASGEEIANAAKLGQNSAPSGPLFVKKNRTSSQPLQPLPSSSFPRPVPQTVQPVENVQPEGGNTTQISSNQQNQTNED
jgi:hypothetical protein